jgi:hypothetical protein
VQELKEELAMIQLMTGWQQQQQDGADSSSRQPYNDLQRQKLQQLVTSWLQVPGDADSSDNSCSMLTQLPLSSVRQLRELLLAVKVGDAATGMAVHISSARCCWHMQLRTPPTSRAHGYAGWHFKPTAGASIAWRLAVMFPVVLLRRQWQVGSCSSCPLAAAAVAQSPYKQQRLLGNGLLLAPTAAG